MKKPYHICKLFRCIEHTRSIFTFRCIDTSCWLERTRIVDHIRIMNNINHCHDTTWLYLCWFVLTLSDLKSSFILLLMLQREAYYSYRCSDRKRWETLRQHYIHCRGLLYWLCEAWKERQMWTWVVQYYNWNILNHQLIVFGTQESRQH